jgi:hypothetical protein
MRIWLPSPSRATYESGAHPNGESSGLLFDLNQARPLQLADFLANAGEAIPAIAARVERNAMEEDWGVFENADFAAVVSEVAGWSADRDGVRSCSTRIRWRPTSPARTNAGSPIPNWRAG